MPSVADQLRQAREAQGLSFRELAELTKIRADYLEALEKANYDPFPAPVYIRGSIRTCATVLRMDVAAVLSDLDAELAQSPEFSEPPSLMPQRRGPLDWITYHLSRVNWRVAAVAGALIILIVGGYVSWRVWERRARQDPLSELGPGRYMQPASTENDLLAVPQEPPPPR